MPNIIMEYSNSVDERVNVSSLLEDLHQVALECGLFEACNIKTRALRCHHWIIGEQGDSVDFIHVRVELLDGRHEQAKSALSAQLLAILQQQAKGIYSLTVDIQDMNRISFSKQLNGNG